MSFVKTFAKFSIGTWIGALISLVSAPVTAWFINPAEFGKASMFTLAYSLLGSVVILGMDQSFSRFYVDVDDDKKHVLLKSVLLPSLLLTFFISVTILLFKEKISFLLFGSPNLTVYVWLLCLMVLIGVISRFSLLSIRMQGEALKFSKIQIIGALLSFSSLILYANYVSSTFEAIVVTAVLAQLFTLIITISYDTEIWCKLFSDVRHIDKEMSRKYLLFGLPFVPTFLIDWLFQGADRTFLRLFSDYSQLGLYALALKISLSLSIVQSGFVTFWLPFSLERFKNDPDDKSIYSNIFNTLTLVFGVLITCIVLAQEVLTLILPKSYNEIIPIFPFLLFIPMLYTVSEVTSVGINFKSRTINHLYVIIISVIVNVLAALLFIPLYGALGASIAMFLGYIAFFVCRTFFGRKCYFFSLDLMKFTSAFAMVLLPVIFTTFFTNSKLYLLGIFTIPVLWIMYKEDLKRTIKLQ